MLEFDNSAQIFATKIEEDLKWIKKQDNFEYNI